MKQMIEELKSEKPLLQGMLQFYTKLNESVPCDLIAEKLSEE